MDTKTLYNKLISDFDLNNIPEEDRNNALTKISETIQKQYLLDVFDSLGKEKFDALQASANMGEEFYGTTLKHLLPNYEKLWNGAYESILMSFKKEKPLC